MRSFFALSLLMILCASASAATVHHTIPRHHVIVRPSQGFQDYAAPGWVYTAPAPTVGAQSRLYPQSGCIQPWQRGRRLGRRSCADRRPGLWRVAVDRRGSGRCRLHAQPFIPSARRKGVRRRRAGKRAKTSTVPQLFSQDAGGIGPSSQESCVY